MEQGVSAIEIPYKRVIRRCRPAGPYSVYILIDPRDSSIRYVGISRQVERRYREHCRGESGVEVSAFVQELKAHNLLPQMQIVEEAIPDECIAEMREYYWMDHFLAEGASLLNKISSSRSITFLV